MITTELRIGNYVSYFNNEVLKVSAVFEKGIHDEYYNGFEFDDIHPIQLTEEWLLKFGFKEMEFDHPDYIPQYYYSKDFENGKVNLNLRYEMILDYGGDFLSNTIDYVHQFQNICFALTGEELMVK